MRVSASVQPDQPGVLDGVPIGEAAAQLGITTDAVRKRIRRRSLRAYKAGGQWYVVLPASRPRIQDGDLDTVLDGGQDDNLDSVQDGQLVAALRDEIGFLRRELEARAEEARRKDAIIMALSQRAALPAPQEGAEAAAAAPAMSAIHETRKRPWWVVWRR